MPLVPATGCDCRPAWSGGPGEGPLQHVHAAGSDLDTVGVIRWIGHGLFKTFVSSGKRGDDVSCHVVL